MELGCSSQIIFEQGMETMDKTVIDIPNDTFNVWRLKVFNWSETFKDFQDYHFHHFIPSWCSKPK